METIERSMVAPILWPPDAKNQLIRKHLDARKDWRHKEKRMTEGEMVGWHHWLNGLEFEQSPGNGEDREACHLHAVCMQSVGPQRVGHDWTTTNDCQSLPGSKGWIGEAQRILRAVKLLGTILYGGYMPLYIYLSPYNIQYQEWALTYTIDFEWQWFVNVHSSVVTNVPLLWGNVHNRKRYAFVVTGCIWKISVPYAQYYCEPKQL